MEVQTEGELKRGLKNRHIQLIALGGAIGTGLFLGIAQTIKMAGPAVLLGYALGGLIAFLIMRQLGEEIPYELTVEIEEFKKEGKLLRISACILVEREGQKKIVIGDGGSRLKLIGTEARLDMVKMFDSKIMLSLWVKVKGGWSDDERALRSLGYGDL